MSTASLVAKAKEKHPEMFCPKKRCLWRTGGGYCPRHKPERPLTATEKWVKAGKPRKRNAVVKRADKTAVWVEDEFGQVIVFIRGSMHYPGDLKVGTKGTLEFQSGGSWALHFFKPDKKG
jgi:hypothetical protein